MTCAVRSAERSEPRPDQLTRALRTDCLYFELGAELEDLTGATLAWTPAFVAAPAASVIHRVEPGVVAGHGPGWLASTESDLAKRGIRLARIYLMNRDAGMDRLLHDGGYACREELVFTGELPESPVPLTIRPVLTDKDWARKRAFHEGIPESPDGHGNAAADLTGLERHKCAHGMEAFLAEIDGRPVGVVAALRGDGITRIKNVLVHPGHRRQSVATALVQHVAALGRSRGTNEQCLIALKGGAGEKLYRTIGMTVVGSCFEWSKRLDRQ